MNKLKKRLFFLFLTGLEHCASLGKQIRVVAISLFPRDSRHLTTEPTINFACESTTSFPGSGGKMRDPGNEVGESSDEFLACTIENWMVVSRGYFSQDSSHSENVLSCFVLFLFKKTYGKRYNFDKMYLLLVWYSSRKHFSFGLIMRVYAFSQTNCFNSPKYVKRFLRCFFLLYSRGYRT